MRKLVCRWVGSPWGERRAAEQQEDDGATGGRRSNKGRRSNSCDVTIRSHCYSHLLFPFLDTGSGITNSRPGWPSRTDHSFCVNGESRHKTGCGPAGSTSRAREVFSSPVEKVRCHTVCPFRKPTTERVRQMTPARRMRSRKVTRRSRVFSEQHNNIL